MLTTEIFTDTENNDEEFNGVLDFVTTRNSPNESEDDCQVIPFQDIISAWDAERVSKSGQAMTIQPMGGTQATLLACTWNIAAVNNNPFEYWITDDDQAYVALMQGVQLFLADPTRDVPVHRVFTDTMFAQLCAEMRAHGIGGLEELRGCWEGDYRARMTVRGFLRDKSIGTKRLASLPDRITNTINLTGGGTRTRPAAINAYDAGALGSVEAWWAQVRAAARTRGPRAHARADRCKYRSTRPHRRDNPRPLAP
jgi:hypothetical protein